MIGRRQLFWATCIWAALCILFTILIIYEVGIK